MSRNVHDLIGDISEMLDTVECEYINVSEDRDYLGRKLKDLNEQEKEFPKAYDLGYEEGFAKGEESIQEKVIKLCEYWCNNKTSTIIELFSGMTWEQIFGDIEKAYDKIIEYEKKKEKEIHIGDEVKDEDGVRYVVNNIEDGYIYVLACDGTAGAFKYSDCSCSKTGKHYPIDEILKELE